MGKKITMQDIADELNVSRVTVWKVLNGKEGVSFELKEKIIKKQNRSCAGAFRPLQLQKRNGLARC